MYRRNRFILIMGFTIIVIWFLSLWAVQTEYEKNHHQFLVERSNLLERSTASVISSYERFSNFIFESAVNTEEVTTLMQQATKASEEEQAKIRMEMYTIFEDMYEVASDYDFRQLHFHLPNGDSFLRMHAPDKFGDNLFDLRETVRMTNTEKRYTRGFEEGRIFNGYRFVYPLFSLGEHVGSVEVSISLESIISILGEMFPSVRSSFIIEKEVMESTVFETERSRYEPSLLAEGYVVDEAVAELISEEEASYYKDNQLLDLVRSSIEDPILSKESFVKLIHYNKRDYVIFYSETENFKGDPVGYFTYILPTTELRTIAATRNISVFTITAIFLLAAAFVYIFHQRQKAMRELARKDPLTNLYNRRYFYQRVVKLMKMHKQKQHYFAILDIDFFKQVNDQFGHGTGDEVLQAIARIMCETLTNDEIFARHGGEEFIVMLPHTHRSAAMIYCDTLRRAIEDYSFSDVGHITVSIGVTEYQQAESLKAAVDRADKALYEAKASGRNKVIYK